MSMPVPVPVQVPGGQLGLVPVAVPAVPVPVSGVPPVPVPVAGEGVDADALASAMLNVSLNGPPSGSVAAAEVDGGLGVQADPLVAAAPLPNSLPADVEGE